MNENKGNPFIILLIAVAILALLSLLPLSNISGGSLKDYNLIGDLLPSDELPVVAAETFIDPDLLAMEQELEDNETGHTSVDSTEKKTDSGYNEPESAYVPVDTGFHSDGSIEDYTEDNGLLKIKNAIKAGNSVRIAMLGDSYIEGDILSQDIRNLLQAKYGGQGAGYVPVSSNMTGFRRSVRQSCSGWIEHDFRDRGVKYTPLSGFYFTPSGKATTTIKGAKKSETGSSWSKTTFLFIAPESTTITMKTADGDETVQNVSASDDVQAIIVDGPTEEVTLSVNSSKLIALGLYVDGKNGIALDNMSIRGYSGIRHNIIDRNLAEQMRRYIDYDLIILEYGINALSAEQTNYSYYAKALEKAITKIKECYPDAEILIMGIGDRGVKVGTEVKSMMTIPAMIAAQRNLARKMGLMFWDTREAMGGNNSVVEWATNREINKDYIHLSFKGGQRMGKLFVDALTKELDD